MGMSIQQIKQEIWEILDDQHGDLCEYQYIPGIHCNEFSVVANMIFDKLVEIGAMNVKSSTKTKEDVEDDRRD